MTETRPQTSLPTCDGLERFKIIFNAIRRYSFYHGNKFTSTELSEFISHNDGVYISPSSIGIILNRIKQVERIGPKTYVICEKFP